MKKRKAEKRLAKRIKAWEGHGKNPAPQGTDMHKPGSLSK